jgi:hypothetical protein
MSYSDSKRVAAAIATRNTIMAEAIMRIEKNAWEIRSMRYRKFSVTKISIEAVNDTMKKGIKTVFIP